MLGLFKVWLNPESMLNILAWIDVRKKLRIIVDTEIESAIIVYVDEGNKRKFVEVGLVHICYKTRIMLPKNNLITIYFLL